jgi:hypothetical protein
MRAYLVDELTPADMQKIHAHLENTGCQAGMEDMFWLHLPEELLNAEQQQHLSECGPFVCSLETGPDWFKTEMLIRGRGKLRCTCIAYADPRQRDWIMGRIDDLLLGLGIPA